LLDTLPSSLSFITMDQLQDLAAARKIDRSRIKKHDLITKLDQWRIEKLSSSYYIPFKHDNDVLLFGGLGQYLEGNKERYLDSTGLLTVSLWFKIITPFPKSKEGKSTEDNDRGYPISR